MRLIDEVSVVLFSRLLVLLQNTLLYIFQSVLFHIYALPFALSKFPLYKLLGVNQHLGLDSQLLKTHLFSTIILLFQQKEKMQKEESLFENRKREFNKWSGVHAPKSWSKYTTSSFSSFSSLTRTNKNLDTWTDEISAAQTK